MSRGKRLTGSRNARQFRKGYNNVRKKNVVGASMMRGGPRL